MASVVQLSCPSHHFSFSPMASVVQLSCPSASLAKPSISSVSAYPRYLHKRRFVAPSAISSISPPSSSSDSIVDALKETVGHLQSAKWKDLWSLNSWVVGDYDRLVRTVNQLESPIKSLTDEQLRAKTVEFRQRLSQGETLADIQGEAFAVVREAARRKLGMRHYDVQIIGGAVLHDGCIAEMKTGEGKTLVSTLAAYLNALAGNGVHGNWLYKLSYLWSRL